MHFFAYGTLMEPAVMTAVTGQLFSSQPAELPGYGRFRVLDAVYPGLVAQPAAVTQGVLYCELDVARGFALGSRRPHSGRGYHAERRMAVPGRAEVSGA